MENIGPGILMCALPKSGSTYVDDSLRAGLNKPGNHGGMGGLFPDVALATHMFEELKETRKLCRFHAPASDMNLRLMKGRIDKVLVTTRDPRQALVSWLYFIPQTVAKLDPLQMEYYGFPADYLGRPIEEQLDWLIDNFLYHFAKWVRDWELAAKNVPWLKVHIARHEHLAINPRAYFDDILDFYEIPKEKFTYPKLPERGHQNFREGKTGEWCSLFTPHQRGRADTILERLRTPLY